MDVRVLSELALRCKAYAKALYYKVPPPNALCPGSSPCGRHGVVELVEPCFCVVPLLMVVARPTQSVTVIQARL